MQPHSSTFKKIAAATFAGCLIAGFGITYLLKSNGNDSTDNEISVLPISQTDKQTDIPAPQPSPEVFLSPTNEQQTESTEIAQQKSVGAEEPATTGKEKAASVEKEPKEEASKEKKTESASPEVPKSVVPQITEKEILQILKTGGSTQGNKFSPQFKIKVVGMKKGESIPESSMDVYDKIRFDQWSSIAITGKPSYDENGCVTSVTINPIYPK